MISLKNVSKRYSRKLGDDVVALNDINLNIEKGKIHGIVGQSGAGKSTLIRCLTALEKPTSGHIYVDNLDLSVLSSAELRKARRKIGMVFQHGELLDSKTTAENIAYPLKLAGVSKEERNKRVEELLELVGLADRGSSYPSQLSGGQKQRVGIARALADEPQVLLCDEPTSALDTDSTKQILNLIYDVRERLGVTVVIITHEMSVVREICDSVSLLEKGSVIESGDIEQILSNENSRLAHELVPAPVIESADVLSEQRDLLLDIYFTSHPGKPTGAKILSLISSFEGDVAGGVFESVGSVQVGRLCIALPSARFGEAKNVLESEHVYVEVR
ncbi:methionine ABC transporter ATP-binding protein [Actinomyces sp. zg-332]|uniref:methionine ABC transporter ATP-binding protein n=1 Tax=Actinomyces sp. zg-332 TaxID=2708340 RepID=UPI00141EF091|nr:methionine ABC transporter ATP-binding protein [Actinomyces sp. zg-332]QPK94061.1 methionine ABC transporter ATP-binding protein [Actinomyces sp. zg-332]